MNRFAVILTHNRPELLPATVAAIGPQVDMVIVIDSASSPAVDLRDVQAPNGEWRVALIQVAEQPPNLSAMWQTGIDCAQRLREAHFWDGPAAPWPWRIAFICDDAPVPPGWFDAVTAAMDETGAVVGCSHHRGFHGAPHVKHAHDSDLDGRMVGWAWVLDAASPVRPDPQFAWWWGDTDADWQARLSGGMVMIGTHAVPNLRPNDFTGTKPGLQVQVGLDGERFTAKWGRRPWL